MGRRARWQCGGGAGDPTTSDLWYLVISCISGYIHSSATLLLYSDAYLNHRYYTNPICCSVMSSLLIPYYINVAIQYSNNLTSGKPVENTQRMTWIIVSPVSVLIRSAPRHFLFILWRSFYCFFLLLFLSDGKFSSIIRLESEHKWQSSLSARL